MGTELPVCQNTEAITTTKTCVMLNEPRVRVELNSIEEKDTGYDIRAPG